MASAGEQEWCLGNLLVDAVKKLAVSTVLSSLGTDLECKVSPSDVVAYLEAQGVLQQTEIARIQKGGANILFYFAEVKEVS